MLSYTAQCCQKHHAPIYLMGVWLPSFMAVKGWGWVLRGLGGSRTRLKPINTRMSCIYTYLEGQFWEGGSRVGETPWRHPTTPQQPTLPPQGHINDASMMNESKSLPMGLEGACRGLEAFQPHKELLPS
eukprot:1145993-Pelagomonas_calceolata.AAC.1